MFLDRLAADIRATLMRAEAGESTLEQMIETLHDVRYWGRQNTPAPSRNYSDWNKTFRRECENMKLNLNQRDYLMRRLNGRARLAERGRGWIA
ncbi:MAG: hypothetical protein OEY16_01325 [Alphaproteobacteria bacterium]|nr:hypothetical protein [Alphaproteobacteria bacterium]